MSNNNNNNKKVVGELEVNFQDKNFRVESDKVSYESDNNGKEFMTTKFEYTQTSCKIVDGTLRVHPTTTDVKFKTELDVPKVGVMIVGWGGNNGTTVTAGILANKNKMSWMTKEGKREADYFGSITQASTVRLGSSFEDGASTSQDVFIPFRRLLPMVSPNDLVVTGWDISGMNMADAMQRAQVLNVDLQRQLRPAMEKMVPMRSIYYPDFIAANQTDRADNVLQGSKADNLQQIRADIRNFKASNGLDKVIVLWSANTERFADVTTGVNDTAANVLASIEKGEAEIAPSTVFAVASILEGSSYINGSPQNTFVPGVVQMAEEHGVFIGGDDFKSGQTKVKSVLVDFLVSAGIKPVSIVSYNHLGNNDGKNLSAPKQFRSKEISKSNVVDDMVHSNPLLYAEGEHPDHTVVIKYVPFVRDSKRAMDEYTNQIFMGGLNTMVMHNTCEDSLLAAPLILDLVILTELMERITVKTETSEQFERFHPVLSVLSYLLKAPAVPTNTPVVNALFAQRQAIVNILRACSGLPPNHHMALEHKVSTAGTSMSMACNAAIESNAAFVGMKLKGASIANSGDGAKASLIA